MFQNFESTKKHLIELSEVINKFKSETVQLRILELLFNKVSTENTLPSSIEFAQIAPKNKAKRRTKIKTLKQSSDVTETKKKASTGNGAISTLRIIYSEGFFSQPKSISDICKHCETNKARRIKPNEISGTLARMVRSNELSRTKNSDNQYIYSTV